MAEKKDGKRRLRSREWFDSKSDPTMTALYLERYMNFGLTLAELRSARERIRELILNRRPASEIRRAAREEGMTFLRESALEKARMGVTTLKEINKVTFIEG